MDSTTTTPTLTSASQCGSSEELCVSSASHEQATFSSRRARRRSALPLNEELEEGDDKEKAALLAEPWTTHRPLHSPHSPPLPALPHDTESGPGQGEWHIPSAGSLCVQIGHDLHPRGVRILGSVLSFGKCTPSAMNQCRRCHAPIAKPKSSSGLFRKREDGLESCSRLVLK